MHKIGILTFQQAINYGAVLQMYALYTFINQLGYPVEILNYDAKKISSGYKAFHLKSMFWPKSLAFELLNYRIKSNRNKKFEQFVHKYIKMSPLVSRSQLKKNLMIMLVILLVAIKYGILLLLAVIRHIF